MDDGFKFFIENAHMGNKKTAPHNEEPLFLINI